MNNNLNMLTSILNIINMPIDDDITNILQRSFHENKNKNKPTEENFIKNLKEVVFDENNDEISCGICLETFKKGEKAICLPCKDKSHYFHIGDNSEVCGGILPWLKDNNSCPVCRAPFRDVHPNPTFESEDIQTPPESGPRTIIESVIFPNSWRLTQEALLSYEKIATKPHIDSSYPVIRELQSFL